jgi:peroxiredoxin/glutaredoxin
MLKNKEGEKVPEVTFPYIKKGKWQKMTTADLFKGKKVIVFSLPGAFTPTCSSTHLPRYNELFSTFKDQGVDSILCVSVNDTFVMNAWGADQEAENITFIPDGNGEFSEKMGLLVDKSAIGFGKRSWRYSMYVEDGTIKKMFIEPEKEGDPFEVSDADTMLNYLAPEAKPVTGVTIFIKEGCPHCARAKEILKEKSLVYTEIKGVKLTALKAMGGAGTYPLIFINGKMVGGAQELEKFF